MSVALRPSSAGGVPEVTDLLSEAASASALFVPEETVERELIELVEALLLAGVEAVGGGLAEQLDRRRRRDHRHRVARRRRVEVVAAEARVPPRHRHRSERHLGEEGKHAYLQSTTKKSLQGCMSHG